MPNHAIAGASVAQATLVCRLRPKQLPRGASAMAGEFELENASVGVVEIEANRHPLQFLNLVVTNSGGTVVSEGHYGDIFSPLGRTYTLRLGPGEKYVHTVSLLGNWVREQPLPGRYTVQAVYEYRGLRAVSEPLSLEVT